MCTVLQGFHGPSISMVYDKWWMNHYFEFLHSLYSFPSSNLALIKNQYHAFHQSGIQFNMPSEDELAEQENQLETSHRNYDENIYPTIYDVFNKMMLKMMSKMVTNLSRHFHHTWFQQPWSDHQGHHIVSIGSTTHYVIFYLNFLSSYNMLLGMPWINEINVVSSTNVCSGERKTSSLRFSLMTQVKKQRN